VKRAIALLTVVHRYLGLVFCLIFVVWFASGIVMVYARMPEYSAAERLARLASLEPAAIHLTPAQALEQATLADTPARIRISTLRSRPVYRFFVQGEWVTVFADDGSVLEQLSPDQALEVVRDAFPAERSTARFVETLREADQWTIGMRAGGPLHLVSLGDAAATNVYVASDTGEIVLKTDRSSRFWGYAGPVMHWFYFRPLRVKGELWYRLVVYGSLVGCVLCVIGLVIGVYRYSLSRRRRGIAGTPYVGWLRWHHYAGLVFGLITLTWLFSGMLSMEPWGVSENPAPRRDQVVAVRGDGVDAARFAIPPQHVLETARREPNLEARSELARRPHELDRRDEDAEQRGTFGSPKEMELIHFMDAPFYRVQDQDGRTLLMTADHGPMVKDGFTQSELLTAASAAMSGVRAREAVWLTGYDSYYADRAGERPLPVLRVKYEDADQTWLYFSSRDGAIVQRETASGRPVRWLYHGLHSLDLPGLYEAGWLWDAVIVTLCVGGLLLSLTSVIVGWRVLRRSRA
jgi:PepSY-associated transmembrane protein